MLLKHSPWFQPREHNHWNTIIGTQSLEHNHWNTIIGTQSLEHNHWNTIMMTILRIPVVETTGYIKQSD